MHDAVAEGHAPLALRAGRRGSALPARASPIASAKAWCAPAPGASTSPRRSRRWACRASWRRCRTSSRRSTPTPIRRSAPPACGSSCAAPAGASCASTPSVDERLDPYRSTEAAATLPGAELHRARQLAAGADGVQPRSRRHAARAGAARHQRHRHHRAQVQQPLVRLRLAQLLCRVPGGAGDRQQSRKSSSARSAATPLDNSRVLKLPQLRAGEPHRHGARSGSRRAAPPESVAAAIGVERRAPRAARLRVPRAVAHRSDRGAGQASRARPSATKRRSPNRSIACAAARRCRSIAIALWRELRRRSRSSTISTVRIALRVGQVLTLPDAAARSAGRRRRADAEGSRRRAAEAADAADRRRRQRRIATSCGAATRSARSRRSMA